MTEMYEQGLQARKDVLGEAYVERSLAGADAFNRDFQEFVTEYCWGACWTREGLPRPTRSLLVLVILGTLGRMEEFALHTRGALRNGVTLDELRDALFHVAVYAGIPAGVEAFRVARTVLIEEGVIEASTD